MPDITIFDWDISKAIQYKPRNLAKPKLPVKVVISFDAQLMQTVGRDPLLHQRIVDACKTEFVKAAQLIDSKLTLADSQVGSARTAQEAIKVIGAFSNFADMEARGAQKRAEQMAQVVWESLAKDRTDYKNYKGKMAVKVGLGVFGAGAAALGLATAIPTGGVSLVLGIIGGIRATIDLAKTLWNLSREAEEIGQRVHSRLATLRKSYQGSSKGAVVGKGLAVSAVNVLTQAEFSNLPKIKSDNDLWKSKLQGVRTKAHELSIKLNEVLVYAEELEKILIPAAGDAKVAKLR